MLKFFFKAFHNASIIPPRPLCNAPLIYTTPNTPTYKYIYYVYVSLGGHVNIACCLVVFIRLNYNPG